MRLFEDEYLEVRKHAAAAGLTASEYLRRRVLKKRVVAQTDLRVLSELRRLGGLLKHVHVETRGAYSELTAEAIRALEGYVRELTRTHRAQAREDEKKEALP